jgi:hypothetical protein
VAERSLYLPGNGRNLRINDAPLTELAVLDAAAFGRDQALIIWNYCKIRTARAVVSAIRR